MGRLQGKVALITGGTSGIGFASAKLFMAEGAKVAITGSDAERLKKAQDALGGEVLGIHADAKDLSTIQPTLDAVKNKFGKLDVLFLNAGVARYSMLQEATEAAFDEMFALHVKSPFFMIQKAVSMMPDGARVIITTSINNRVGMAPTHIYATTKAAARQMVRTLAAELAPRKIRLNCLSPGPVITDIGRTVGVTEEEGAKIAEYVLGKVPLNRFAEASELATAALFLASDDSSFVNGTELVVDGGWSEVGL